MTKKSEDHSPGSICGCMKFGWLRPWYMACRIITSDLAFSYDDTRSCTIAMSAGLCQFNVRIGLEPLSILLLTSRNLLSCCSWPFSVRS